LVKASKKLLENFAKFSQVLENFGKRGSEVGKSCDQVGAVCECGRKESVIVWFV